MTIFTLLQFAAKVEAWKIDVDIALQAIVAEVALHIYHEAYNAIGTYKFGWAPLGPQAIDKHGDTPLLDTGQLRNSIGVTIDKYQAWVGTNDKVMQYHEFGTSRMPARPVFGPAALGAEKFIDACAKRHLKAAFAGHGAAMRGLHEFMEALHLLKEVYNEFKKIGRDFNEFMDENRRRK